MFTRLVATTLKAPARRTGRLREAAGWAGSASENNQSASSSHSRSGQWEAVTWVWLGPIRAELKGKKGRGLGVRTGRGAGAFALSIDHCVSDLSSQLIRLAIENVWLTVIRCVWSLHRLSSSLFKGQRFSFGNCWHIHCLHEFFL